MIHFGDLGAFMKAFVNKPTLAPISTITGFFSLVFVVIAAANFDMRLFRRVFNSRPTHLIFCGSVNDLFKRIELEPECTKNSKNNDLRKAIILSKNKKIRDLCATYN